MIFTSAQRYLTPKWQARVTPRSKCFRFNNGVTVSNLWELKQALRIVREDIIAEHVNKDNNDIADWIENIVKDKELADSMRTNTNRWALIVALERAMMRTINLPNYVAARWLEKVELPFYFQDGKNADSLESLKDCLEKTDDRVIEFHLEREPNDIAKWVNDIIGDYQLAEILTESTNRQQMLTFISDHIEMLNDALTCK